MLLNKNTRKKLSYVMLPVMMLYTVLPTTAYGTEAYAEVQASASNNNAGSTNNYDDSKAAAEALNKEAAKSAAQAAKEKEENPASSSEASNYTMGIGAEVNVQTGQLDVTFNDIKLNGMSEDVGIDLGISNGGGAKKILGLPLGWKFSIDYIDTKTPQKLYMNGSQNYTIDSKYYSYDSEGEKYYSGLRYCTSKGIKFEDKKAKIDLPYDTKLKYCYILSTSKGSHEYFDYNGKLICQDDRFGNHIIYSYDKPEKSPYEAKLIKITDSYGQDITIGYKGNVITATMPDTRKVVYDFSSRYEIKITGVSGREAVLRLNEDNKVSEIKYPTGGTIEYLYANNAILVQGAPSFAGIKEVKQKLGSKTISRTEYNYNANPGHSFAGAGLCDYASDKDALLESSNNSYKYATKIISHRTPDCGGAIESLQTFNFLHLPLSSIITSIPDPSDPSKSRKLLVETETRYMGEHGKGEDFPAFNQLHANYNLPSKVTSTIKGKEGKKGRVHKVETKYDDYDRQVSVTNYNDESISSETETIYGSYDLVTKQSIYDSIDKTTTIATNKLSSDGKYITESQAAIVGKDKSSTDGKTTTLTADEHGRMTSSKLSNSTESSTSTTDYKQNGNLLTVITTDELGNSTSQEIDIRNGNIVSETDAKGNSVRYTYDTTGTLLTKTYPDGSWEKTDSSNPNKTVTSYSNGIINTSILDGFGRVIEEYDNFGGKNTVTYNELGKPAVKTDVFGHSIKYTYDYQGRETSATDSLGNVKSTVYDDVEQTATQSINGIKAVTSLLDDNGNVKSQTSFLSNSDSVASSTYNGKNMKIASALKVAGKENIISSVSSYDIDGNLVRAEISTADGTNGTSEYTPNLFGDVISRKTQFSSVSPGVEKGTGEVKSEIKTYNKIGQLVSLTNQAGQCITYTYDANGNLATMKDFAGNIFSYTYDNMGRMLTMEGPDYKIENKYYKPGPGVKGEEGQLQSRKLLNPKDGTIIDTISYAYDVQGRLSSVTYMNGKSMSMTYDRYDRVVSMTDFAGIVTTYKYDERKDGVPSNIVEVSNTFGKASYSYFSGKDNAMFGDGKTVSKVTYSNGVTINFKYKVSKGKSPILASVETCDDANELISGSYYEYDDLDRVATLTQKSATSSDDSNCNNTRYFTYNDMNQLIKEDVFDKNAVLVTSTSYTFDINGNIKRKEITGEQGEIKAYIRYAYNSINQLIKITEGPSSGAQIVKIFKYDKNGNMTEIVSENSNTTIKVFTYNSINQLVEYSDKQQGVNVCYEYNAESLRKCKYFKGDGGRRINYYYSQDGEIMNEEACKGLVNNGLASNDQINNDLASNGRMTSYLIAGTRVLRAVISSTDNSEQSTDNVSWYIMNGKDVVSTVDNDDETTNVYNYNAYGEDTDLNNGGSVDPVKNTFDINSNPYKYSGYYLDEESGMYYLQARYYSPELMRFISRDTYDLSNRYAYGDGDPISKVDRNGHMPQWVGGVVGAAVGLLLGFLIPGAGSILGAMAGGALSSAGATLVGEAVNGEEISLKQIGISAGLGAATGLVFGAIGWGVSKMKAARQVDLPGQFNEIVDNVRLDSDYNEKMIGGSSYAEIKTKCLQAKRQELKWKLYDTKVVSKITTTKSNELVETVSAKIAAERSSKLKNMQELIAQKRAMLHDLGTLRIDTFSLEGSSLNMQQNLSNVSKRVEQSMIAKESSLMASDVFSQGISPKKILAPSPKSQSPSPSQSLNSVNESPHGIISAFVNLLYIVQ